jgi:Fe-S-cluster containining protein
MGYSNPCQNCGACCSYFQVAFYWREAEPADSPHPVPLSLTEELSETKRVMKGTSDRHSPRCCALKGEVGSKVACTIYGNRPTPCRNFQASYENGVHNPRCDQARLAHGLKPLRAPDSPAPSLNP